MSDVIASVEAVEAVEAVEEVRPVELSADLLDDQLIGQLVDRARASGLQLTGEGGLLQQPVPGGLVALALPARGDGPGGAPVLRERSRVRDARLDESAALAVLGLTGRGR